MRSPAKAWATTSPAPTRTATGVTGPTTRSVRTGIAADVQYNVACSGATPWNLIAGGPAVERAESGRQPREGPQHQDQAYLSRRGRQRRGHHPVRTGRHRLRHHPDVFTGPCYPRYTHVLATRTDGSRQAVEQALTSIRQTMTAAGYLRSDYELVLWSYPSPASPDVEDNPDFPGWYGGGCLLYLAGAAFARNKAAPMVEWALRAAAANTGTRYLDNSRLFHGHEVGTDNTSVRGSTSRLASSSKTPPDSRSTNYRGHGMFAGCMTAFYNSGQATGSCVDPASTGHALYSGRMKFKQLRNAATGKCADGQGYATAPCSSRTPVTVAPTSGGCSSANRSRRPATPTCAWRSTTRSSPHRDCGWRPAPRALASSGPSSPASQSRRVRVRLRRLHRVPSVLTPDVGRGPFHRHRCRGMTISRATPLSPSLAPATPT